MESVFPTEPSTSKELLRRSLTLYQASFHRVFLLALLLGIIAFLPSFLSHFVGQELFFTTHSFSVEKLWLLVVNFCCLFVVIAMLWKIYCVAIGRNEPWIEDVSVGLHKVTSVLVATLFVGFIVFGVTLLIFALQILLHQESLLFHAKPWSMFLTITVFVGQLALIIYLATLFIFLIPLIAIEKYNILKAMERSIYLVWNYWWRTFTLQITPWLLYIFTAVVFRFLIVNLIYFINPNLASYAVISTIVYFVLFIIFMPWGAALLLIQLKDLEVRKNLQNL